MSTATSQTLSPEIAQAYRDLLLGKIESEFKTTARVIAAVPEAKKDYKPEPNSRSAWDLATHLAQSEVWFLNSIADADFAWTGDPPKPADTVAGLAAWFEKNTTAAAQRVRGLSPQQLLKTASFFGIMNDAVVLYLLFAHEHTVHHRAQLSTYLRPMGAKVPDIYGGSFDEPFTGQ